MGAHALERRVRMSVITKISRTPSTSWVVRRLSEMWEYLWRWWCDQPLEFESIGPDAGTAIGKPFRVALKLFHDRYRVHAVLTRHVLLWGKRITAFRILEWQSEGTGKDTVFFVVIQPCRRITLREMLNAHSRGERAAS